MIEPTHPDVVSHALVVEDGRTAQVLVTARGNLAVVYGDDRRREATLVVRARCPLNDDVLRVNVCDCARRVSRAVDVARRAPLGVVVYVARADVDHFADVLVLLAQLPSVDRVFLPEYNVGDAALLRNATDLSVLHRPTCSPPDDLHWPNPVPTRTPIRRLLDRVEYLRRVLP